MSDRDELMQKRSKIFQKPEKKDDHTDEGSATIATCVPKYARISSVVT